MNLSVRAICLTSVRFADNSLIVKMFSRELGLISIIAKGVFSGRTKKKAAFFQPFSILDLTISYHPEKKMHSLKEVSTAIPILNVHTVIEKSSIAVFLSEVISKSIHHEHKDEPIYEYLESFILTLNEIRQCGNIHLSFLLEFCKLLGFYPLLNKDNHCCFFDLQRGEFISFSTETTLPKETSEILYLFASAPIAERILYPLNRETKDTLIHSLLDYYKLHVIGFKQVKSLEVLQELFHN